MSTTITKPRIQNVVAFCGMAMIAFQFYWQYWFVNLFGAWTMNPLLPIAILAILALVFVWRNHRYPDLRVTLLWMWSFLACYLAWSTISIFVNESGLSGAIHWLVDVWSAAAVFFVIHGLKNLRDDSTFNRSLKVLFLVGVGLSIYALLASHFYPPGSRVPPVLKWGDATVKYFTGDGIRLTVPGLGSNHYPAMLLPLIFLGAFWAFQTTRVTKAAFFLGTALMMYCVFATRTRAAFVPLICGFVYLVLVRCIRGRAVLLSGCVIGILVLMNPAVVDRMTVLVPIIRSPGRQILMDLVIDPESGPHFSGEWENQDHIVLAADTIGLASKRPILGIGMTRLVDFQNTVFSFFAGKTHNNYLSIAAGYGFPAMIFYISFIISLAVYVNRIVQQSEVHSDVWRSGHTWIAILISYALYLNAEPAEFHFVWLWFALTGVWLLNRRAEIKLTKEETTDSLLFLSE